MSPNPDQQLSAPALVKGATDVVIVGGGVVGLWCASRAAALGLRCVLAEKGVVGQGASGGLLGALMPHQPINWDPKKAFQLDALLSLSGEIRDLQERTDAACGYRRCGRVVPIRTERKLEQSRRWMAGAKDNWPGQTLEGTPLSFTVIPEIIDDRWLALNRSRLGCDHDTLSARLNPRSLVAALSADISDRVEVREGAEVVAIEAEDGAVRFRDGQVLIAGHIIVANGWVAGALLETCLGLPLASETTLMQGVKGQAALLKPAVPMPADHPIIYDGGTYVVGHDDGLVAVGSTSENTFSDPTSTNGLLDDVLATATALCPGLAGATVLERWAGVRPKAIGRDPMIGPLPGAERVIAATGGFKITLGIAHRMADAAVGFVTGQASRDTVPKRFRVEAHLEHLKE